MRESVQPRSVFASASLRTEVIAGAARAGRCRSGAVPFQRLPKLANVKSNSRNARSVGGSSTMSFDSSASSAAGLAPTTPRRRARSSARDDALRPAERLVRWWPCLAAERRGARGLRAPRPHCTSVGGSMASSLAMPGCHARRLGRSLADRRRAGGPVGLAGGRRRGWRQRSKPERDEADRHREPQRGEPDKQHGGGRRSAGSTPPMRRQLLLEQLLGHAEPPRDRDERAGEGRGGVEEAVSGSGGALAEAAQDDPEPDALERPGRRSRAASARRAAAGVVSSRSPSSASASFGATRPPTRPSAPGRCGSGAISRAGEPAATRRTRAERPRRSRPRVAQTSPPGKLRLPMAMRAMTPMRSVTRSATTMGARAGDRHAARLRRGSAT